MRIYPNFDPFYSYDYKFAKELRVDFVFVEDDTIIGPAFDFNEESLVVSDT